MWHMCMRTWVYNYSLPKYNHGKYANCRIELDYTPDKHTHIHTHTAVYICSNIWMRSGSFAFLLLNSPQDSAETEPPNIIFIYTASILHSHSPHSLSPFNFNFSKSHFFLLLFSSQSHFLLLHSRLSLSASLTTTLVHIIFSVKLFLLSLPTLFVSSPTEVPHIHITG